MVSNGIENEGDSTLNRDNALAAAREQFEAPIWSLIEQLETTLAGLAKVAHVDMNDLRAVGSVLNSALPDAANAAGLSKHGLSVAHCEFGRSNKLTGALTVDGNRYTVSFELHLCGPQGGTSKVVHQFVGYDIEEEPTFPGFEVEAPPDILAFVACHLGGTGVSVARAYFKFADKVDQRKIEIHRNIPPMTAGVPQTGPVDAPTGTKLKLKNARGEKETHGSKADKREDAASSS